ncbi:hypothetical protein [Bradyrhizobium sp. GM2.2]|uniref:hypothetical protein n=1 Tax=Bradyrhizobium sp. GM2.2 TaxID=3156358 RepID=UPI0033990DB9
MGTAYAGKVARETRKLDALNPACDGDYVPLYRAVGKTERLEIAAIHRYVILSTGIGAKQFMLKFEDAKWIVGFNQQYETTPTKEMFIVTSRVCAATLAMADRFTDAGRAVVSFGQEGLQMVNLDASRTGRNPGDLDLGSREMKTYKVDLIADVEMTGDDPHPPVLTTEVRPNFLVGEHYCMCFILETTPPEGVALHGKGSFRAHVICSEQARPLFTNGGEFELRSAKRVFATGRFREIVSVNEAEATES